MPSPIVRTLGPLMLTLCLLACRAPVPDSHTSLALDPGSNPGPPAQRLAMVWLHHSTGDALLAGGLRAGIDTDNIAFHDINYGEATVEGYVVGDHTDPPDFPKLFNTPKYLTAVLGWELPPGAEHQIVMFKSCYPASDITSEQMLEQYKSYYRSMLPTFRAHPKTLFIPMSTPPLAWRRTTPQNAARARQWSKWVTKAYALDVPNVQVFDLFGAMAVLEDKPRPNTLPPQFAQAATDSHPTPAAGRAVTRLFVPWLNRAIRAAGLSK